MSRKCLIVYSSLSGNTAKVAERFKSTFEKNGWECDTFKIDRKTDFMRPPFNFSDYDFVCVGSGLIMHLPSEEILNVIQKQFFGIDPRIFKKNRYGDEPDEEAIKPPKDFKDTHRKITLDGSKKAVIFITYAGYEFGPEEAEPALKLLELEIQHLGFQCIGHFACPGKFLNLPTPESYHGDIRNRPDERDLLRAEFFIEDMLEAIADRRVK